VLQGRGVAGSGWAEHSWSCGEVLSALHFPALTPIAQSEFERSNLSVFAVWDTSTRLCDTCGKQSPDAKVCVQQGQPGPQLESRTQDGVPVRGRAAPRRSFHKWLWADPLDVEAGLWRYTSGP